MITTALVFLCFLLGWWYGPRAPAALQREVAWGLITLYCLLRPTGQSRFLGTADRVAFFEMVDRGE